MDKRGVGSSGTHKVVVHQASFIKRVLAPTASPASNASPSLAGFPALQLASVGAGRYCSLSA